MEALARGLRQYLRHGWSRGRGLFDNHIRETAKTRVLDLEVGLNADVALYFGPIFPSIEKRFRDFIEELKNTQTGETARNRLAIVLNSPGGSEETVEKLVEIVRYHYAEVHFVIPDEAMSAGTIFAMSGDAIFMDYTSALGPIDPQVKQRAEEIATLLADNKIWHSHGRKIGVKTLQNLLRLEIVDYSADNDLRSKILAYSEFITDYINRHEYPFFLHHRRWF
jgi:membrane-bound ClpP family serine protease